MFKPGDIVNIKNEYDKYKFKVIEYIDTNFFKYYRIMSLRPYVFGGIKRPIGFIIHIQEQELIKASDKKSHLPTGFKLNLGQFGSWSTFLGRNMIKLNDIRFKYNNIHSKLLINTSSLNNNYFKGLKIKYIGNTVDNLIHNNIYTLAGKWHKNHIATLHAGTNLIVLKEIKIIYNNELAGIPDYCIELIDERFSHRIKRFSKKEKLIEKLKIDFNKQLINNFKQLKINKHKKHLNDEREYLISILENPEN